MNANPNFIEFSRQLFDNELLASEGTVRAVLEKYELAKIHGHEFVGVVQKDYRELYSESTHVYKGKDGERVGVLQVRGALTYEESFFTALCGMTSYEGLQNRADYLINDRGIDHLVLEVNSGGGMAYGCFEKASYVKRLAEDNGVKITTYVDGVGFSGGYAWTCIADEVIMNPLAQVGSIGVVLPLVNTSEMDKKEGIQRIYITAGKSKVPFDKDGNFTDKFLAKIKAGVDDTYDMFVDHVSSMRGMTQDAVMETEADTFRAKEAVKLGLADKIMTVEEFHNYIGKLNGETRMAIQTQSGKEKVEGNEESGNSVLIAQLSGQITELQAQVTANANATALLQGQVTTLTQERDKAVQDLSEANAKIKAANDEKEKVILDSRKSRISALVSVDDVEEHMDFVSGFDADKFDKYIAKLEKQQEKIESSFTPEGVDTTDQEQEELSVEEKALKRLQARNGTA